MTQRSQRDNNFFAKNNFLNLFQDAEASIVDSELSEPRDEFLFHELTAADRR